MDDFKRNILFVVIGVIAVIAIGLSCKSYMASQPHEAYHIPSKPGQISPKQAEVNAMNAAKNAQAQGHGGKKEGGVQAGM